MAAQPYPFNQRVAPTSILAQTFDGTPAGMNMALPPNEIDDTQARMLVDWLLDQPGITRQRGPVTGATGIPALPRPGCGLFSTLNPQGAAKFATLTGNGSNGFFSVLKDDNSGWVDIAWPFNLTSAPPFFYVDAKPAAGGGLIIGVSSDYGVTGISQGVAFWFGATKPNFSPASITATRGSTAVTVPSGATANVVPGMFLFANTDDPYTNAYIGCVLSVNSDTSVTLTSVSRYTSTAKAGTFQSIRGITPHVTVGEITTSTAAPDVTGGDTKFISQGLNTGTWQLYRASDMAFVGKVSSVTTDSSLRLAANAAVSMASEAYVAVRVDGDYSISNPTSSQKVGFLNAPYANRQWYANKGSDFNSTSRVWFSDENDPEGLDLSASGNWLQIDNAASVNEPIRAIATAYNGLVVFKETESFIIVGNSPASFSVNKLEDDGVLSAMSVQEFGGGVIWAGREGINLYDGVQVTNLVENSLGQVWKDTIRTLDPSTYRLWSMLDRDHYFLFLESVAPPFSITKGNVSTPITRLTVVVNMTTRAVGFGTNLDIRGSAIVPASANRHAYFLVNGTDGFGHVCDGEALFIDTGIDTITCTGNSLGPSVYLESKKFDAGDGLRLKRWKQVAMNYLCGGGDLVMDIVLGLNDVGQTATTTFPKSVFTWSEVASNVRTWTGLKHQYSTWSQVITSVFIPARIRMQKKSQFLSVRIYGSVANLTDAKIGPYQVAYKLQRVGRI